MSVKGISNKGGRSVMTGIIAGLAAQLLFSSAYALAIVKGRGNADNAEIIMYAIAFVAALICGSTAVNCKGGTRLNALISGIMIAVISVAGAVIFCVDDIKMSRCAIIFAIFIVASYIGSVLKLVKSNKKIHKIQKKKN